MVCGILLSPPQKKKTNTWPMILKGSVALKSFSSKEAQRSQDRVRSAFNFVSLLLCLPVCLSPVLTHVFPQVMTLLALFFHTALSICPQVPSSLILPC